MTRRAVAITGLSGVGKSTVIKTIAASMPLEHFQASALIKEGRRAAGDKAFTQDQLRLMDIDENQQLLVRGFLIKAETSTGLVILDGHTVIEHGDQLIRIDARVFSAIGIDGMIFLADDPAAIALRRRSDTARERPISSINDLQLIQQEAKDHAGFICRELDIPLYIFRPDELALIAQTLRIG